jgi:metallo-beta-lactamase class B
LRQILWIPLLASLSLLAPASQAALDAEQASWNQPVTPFRIIGDIYYVGASDITSYLIATPQGLILLDGGFAETVPQITSNIAALGFKLGDVKLLLNSHAHFDHAGGLAALMAAGGKGDFAFGDRLTFEPVHADRLFQDGDQVELGGVVMTAHLTPGHTKGCTTWTMRVTEAGKPYDVVFVCSLSSPGYQLVDNTRYAGIVADYLHSFAVMKSLPCDVFLGAHGLFFGLTDKIARLQRRAPGNPFIDPQGYRRYLADSEQGFRQKLAEQQRQR